MTLFRWLTRPSEVACAGRVNVGVVQVEEMTGRLPLGVAGKVCWNNVRP